MNVYQDFPMQHFHDKVKRGNPKGYEEIEEVMRSYNESIFTNEFKTLQTFLHPASYFQEPQTSLITGLGDADLISAKEAILKSHGKFKADSYATWFDTEYKEMIGKTAWENILKEITSKDTSHPYWETEKGKEVLKEQQEGLLGPIVPGLL